MNKQGKLIVVLVAILMIISLYQNSMLSKIRNELENQRYSLQRVAEDINQIDSSVYRTLDEWERENRWIRDSYYRVESISEDLSTMTVSIIWDFNSLGTNEDVYLNIGRYDRNGTIANSWEKIDVEPVADLHYEKVLTLPFKANYDIEVIAESEDEKRSAELTKIEVYERLINHIDIDSNIRTASDRMYLSINLFNMTNKKIGRYFEKEDMTEQFLIEKATLEIYVKGKLFETVDLLKEGEIDDFDEDVEVIDYTKTFESPDFEKNELKAKVKIIDKLGLEFEKEIEP